MSRYISNNTGLERRPNLQRFFAAFVALVLGWPFISVPIQDWWTDHWLLKDGQEGMAMVTLLQESWTWRGGQRGRSNIEYEYTVNENIYTGAGPRSLQNPKYANVIVGEHTVVHYSQSHPWLSRIDMPQSAIPLGWPLLLLVWFIEARLIVAIIKPGSKWAMKFSDKNAFRIGEGPELQPSERS